MPSVVDMIIFFFSSRRRHTRLQGDWSSDVCSSDLAHCAPGTYSIGEHRKHGQCRRGWPDRGADSCAAVQGHGPARGGNPGGDTAPCQEIGRAQSELQSPCNLVCRLLLEKKQTYSRPTTHKRLDML